MGRTNGKLINFLKVYLMKFTFMNLRYDSEDPDTFQIELPRFEKHKDLREYEKILKAWYQCNGKIHLYKSYSNAKAVFQAALKKSIYLVQLKKVGKVLRYKFATKEEAEEKRLLLKEKSKEQDPNHEFELEASSLSPSPSETSSGYHSENEFGSSDSPVHENVMDESLIDEILKDPTISDQVLPCDLIEDFFMDQTESPDLCDNSFDDLVQLFEDNLAQELQPPIENVALESQQLMPPVECASLPMSVQEDHESKSVLEVNPIPVLNANITKKFFWRCKQKMIFESTLLLICDREEIEDENNIINEGQIFIPNEVWEPGVSYKLHKFTEVGDKNFVFFSQSSV